MDITPTFFFMNYKGEAIKVTKYHLVTLKDMLSSSIKVRLKLLITFLATRFKGLKFYILPIEYTYVFCVDLRTNSDYFPIQH